MVVHGKATCYFDHFTTVGAHLVSFSALLSHVYKLDVLLHIRALNVVIAAMRTRRLKTLWVKVGQKERITKSHHANAIRQHSFAGQHAIICGTQMFCNLTSCELVLTLVAPIVVLLKQPII